MKNIGFFILLLVCCMCLSFTLGLYLGRNANHTSVQVSVNSPADNDAQGDLLININTATAEELTLLPGIGTTLSQNIVQYRQEHGPFASVSELLNVPGIGTGRLTAILDYITIGD